MANTLFQSGKGGGGVEAFTAENISASGTITSLTSGVQYRPIQGAGGAVTTSGTPFGTSLEWQTGTTVILRGLSDTNTVTIANNDATDGVILNGDATLLEHYVLELVYDATAERWVERGRNF